MRVDDEGREVPVPSQVRRVVSLVPSLTETVTATARELLVGATDWCTHPPDLAVERLRGTKNPHVRRIVELAPDLVVANREENRERHVRQLREAGVPVWVTDIRTVPGALGSLRRLPLPERSTPAVLASLQIAAWASSTAVAIRPLPSGSHSSAV
jgi:ABC-type Fe3+-hydroxamate transport system substrate-binding protein